MNKIRIAASSIFYPVFMGRYIIEALERRDDVELFSLGPSTDTYIPWNGGMNLSPKYVKSPDLSLPRSWIGTRPMASPLTHQLPWKPDLFLIIDAGFHFADRPPGDQVALIATDPHALSEHYKYPRRYVDYVFNMQTPYMEEGDLYLPYAVDDNYFYPETLDKQYDACMIGLLYEKRLRLAKNLDASNIRTYIDIGLVYDEYREKYNQSKCAVSWSSKDDLPCRVWEGMGMNLPVVTNRVSDLTNFFSEGDHYLGFDTVSEAVEMVQFLIHEPYEAQEIANRAYNLVVNNHTWDHRVQRLLEDVDLL